jgi:hypothetical protein
MAYSGTTSNLRTTHSGSSRGSLQQQQPHIYEEPPYYANERPTPRQSVGGESRRSAGVCYILILFIKINSSRKRNY